ncbi:MAG: NmrA family NAD(P)-binding protein [Candidatus Krumholzibacteria bacterium]|nr:NmrA family NAD(P)-binding protein [Candidatus Krumholzibacteria bacterium]
MKIAVTTPTGNIGRALTIRLLGAGEQPILLARQPEKVREFIEQGATVQHGSLEDKEFVVEATRGVDVLFWLTPADYGSRDLRVFQNTLGDNAAAAVRTNKIPRVVDLSSVGAQLAQGTGPVVGLRDVEKKLEATGAHITHLRPGYFMENFFMTAGSMASHGAVFLPVPGSARVPFIATPDIAAVAAERILDATWTGRSVIELVGPEEISFEEAATRFGDAIGKKVSFSEATPGQTREALTAMGVHENTANLFIELYDAIGQGKFTSEASPKKGTTTLNSFAKDVFRPTFDAMTR